MLRCLTRSLQITRFVVLLCARIYRGAEEAGALLCHSASNIASILFVVTLQCGMSYFSVWPVAASLEQLQVVSAVSWRSTSARPSYALRDAMEPLSVFAPEEGRVVCKVKACRGLYKENLPSDNSTTFPNTNWDIANLTTSAAPYLLRVESNVPVDVTLRSKDIEASWQGSE